MIIGIGTDFASVERIKKVFSSEKRLRRIFTEEEICLFIDKDGKYNWERAAANFSMKEAVGKALGTGLGRLKFRDIEILRNPAGQPVLTPESLEILKKHIGFENKFSVHLSVTHEGGFASGFAVAEGVVENG